MSIYKQNKNIIYRQEADEAIIFNPDTSDILVINSTGCLVWSMCDGKKSQEDIAKAIIEEFEVSDERAKEDVDKFLSILAKRQFIEEAV